MLVVDKKILVVELILNQEFRNATFYAKKVAFFYENLIQESEEKF